MRETDAPPNNFILRSLKHEDYLRFLPFSKKLTLGPGDILFEAGDRIDDFYFVDSGMASLLSTTEGGATIEVGMVGNEGFVGSALLLKTNRMPYRSMMQIGGETIKIQARPVLDQFDKNVDFRNLILRYLHMVLTQVS